MIGDIHYMKDRAYVESNRRGTWEKLPHIRWYRQLELLFRSLAKRWTVQDTREFCQRYEYETHHRR